MIPNQSASAVLVLLIDEETRFQEISRIGAGIFDIQLLHLQATIFCKSLDFSYFQTEVSEKAVLPSVLLLCGAVNAADFLTKNDFGMFQSQLNSVLTLSKYCRQGTKNSIKTSIDTEMVFSRSNVMCNAPAKD